MDGDEVSCMCTSKKLHHNNLKLPIKNSSIIGLLVYLFLFTNMTALKSFMMDKTDFKLGFKLGYPAVSGKHLAWKDIMKE